MASASSDRPAASRVEPSLTRAAWSHLVAKMSGCLVAAVRGLAVAVVVEGRAARAGLAVLAVLAVLAAVALVLANDARAVVEVKFLALKHVGAVSEGDAVWTLVGPAVAGSTVMATVRPAVATEGTAEAEGTALAG